MATISYSSGVKFNEMEAAVSTVSGYDPGHYYIAEYSPVDVAIYLEDQANLRNGYYAIGVENVAIRYDFSDNTAGVSLSGYVNGDYIIGSSSYDQLFGGAGDDTIVGGARGDSLDGGDGVDTLSYETSASAVFISLQDGSARFGDADGDMFINFENLRGSLGNDTLSGDAGANVIEGWGGADRIMAQDGDDRIILRGATEANVVDGGNGHDILTLEGGYDYVFDAFAISGIEQVNVGGGAVADFSAVQVTIGTFKSTSDFRSGVDLTTTDNAESIRLGRGMDTLDAGGGDDKIYVVSDGQATIDGGAGTDRLFVQSGFHMYNDETLTNVEMITVRSGATLELGELTTGMRITSTSAAADASETFMFGSAGDDVMRAGAGGDIIAGGFGDDRLFGGAGADNFAYGGAGFGRDQVTADLAMDRISLYQIANDLGDLSFRTAANGEDVVVTFADLDPKTNAIFLKGVTLEDVQAAADSFFIFVA